MKFSKQFTLNLTDLQKSLIMAVGGAVFGILYPIFDTWLNEPGWLLPIVNFKLVIKAALNAALPYLLKNWISPTPKQIMIDPSITTIIDNVTKEPIVNHIDVAATVVTAVQDKLNTEG